MALGRHCTAMQPSPLLKRLQRAGPPHPPAGLRCSAQARQLSSTRSHSTVTPSAASRQSSSSLGPGLSVARGSLRSNALRPCGAAAAEASPAAVEPLASLELQPALNAQGLIDPAAPDGTAASVFAVFDANKKLQYIGFSKDIRNSLRTVFSRRPEKVFYYKAFHLEKLDQTEMLGVRAAWYEEVGGPPTGNKLAMERALWEKPVDGGAISNRGKLEAAKAQVVVLLTTMKARGCKEEFEPNPMLLQNGQVDFLPAAALTKEAQEAAKARQIAMAKLTRRVPVDIEGDPGEMQLLFKNTYKTNGGFMFDLVVTFEEKETVHRVIVGKEYYEPFGVQAETVVGRALSFLVKKRVPRQTEGMLTSHQFPVNYFSVSEVEQWFPDFQETYGDEGMLPGDSSYWRFNRIYNYGSKDEDSSFSTVRAPGAIDSIRSQD